MGSKTGTWESLRVTGLLVLFPLAVVWFHGQVIKGSGTSRMEKSAGQDTVPRHLVPGTPTAAQIDRTLHDWVSFDCRVPEDTMELAVTVIGAPADLDCYVRFGAPMADWDDDADHGSVTDAWNERLRISSHDHPPLVPGRCYIDVVYPYSVPPRIDGLRTEQLDFSVRVDLVRAQSHGTLAPRADHPTSSAAGTLDSENGHILFCTI